MKIMVSLSFFIFVACALCSHVGGTFLQATPTPISSVVQRPVFHRCNWCAENAVCIDNSYCRCISEAYVGNPYFLCYKPGEFDVCELCDDPVLTTENKEMSSLTYLSSTLLMDKTVPRVRYPGTCRIRAVVTSYRLNGKSYPRCVLVRTDLTSIAGKVTCTFVYKICALSRPDGTVSWQIYSGVAGLNGHIRYTTWRTLLATSYSACPHTLCRCPVYFQVTRGKILTMKSSCCSLKLGFRPFIKRLDWLKSGIFIMTYKSKSTPFPSIVKYYNICLRPGIKLDDLKIKLQLSQHQQAMSFLALTNMPRDLVPLPPEQIAMIFALLRCTPDKRQKFFTEADFMLNSHPFIHAICGTKEGFSEIMNLVKLTADWYCQADSKSCQSAIGIIKARAKGLLSRPKKFPKLAAFVGLNCTAP